MGPKRSTEIELICRDRISGCRDRTAYFHLFQIALERSHFCNEIIDVKLHTKELILTSFSLLIFNFGNLNSFHTIVWNELSD